MIISSRGSSAMGSFDGTNMWPDAGDLGMNGLGGRWEVADCVIGVFGICV